jgi:hypothetical protein
MPAITAMRVPIHMWRVLSVSQTTVNKNVTQPQEAP